MFSDLRYAIRQLAASPGFTAVAVLTLALGIGANTAIFGVINAALLRPLPYSQAHQLVEIWHVPPTGTGFPVISGPQFKQVRDHAKSFSDAAAYHRVNFNLIERGRAERISGLEVSANFLSVLRLNPLHGQRFNATDDRVGGENRVVVLTHEWWLDRHSGAVRRGRSFGLFARAPRCPVESHRCAARRMNRTQNPARGSRPLELRGSNSILSATQNDRPRVV